MLTPVSTRIPKHHQIAPCADRVSSRRCPPSKCCLTMPPLWLNRHPFLHCPIPAAFAPTASPAAFSELHRAARHLPDAHRVGQTRGICSVTIEDRDVQRVKASFLPLPLRNDNGVECRGHHREVGMNDHLPRPTAQPDPAWLWGSRTSVSGQLQTRSHEVTRRHPRHQW